MTQVVVAHQLGVLGKTETSSQIWQQKKNHEPDTDNANYDDATNYKRSVR
jgi:hypothetical protein